MKLIIQISAQFLKCRLIFLLLLNARWPSRRIVCGLVSQEHRIIRNMLRPFNSSKLSLKYFPFCIIVNFSIKSNFPLLKYIYISLKYTYISKSKKWTKGMLNFILHNMLWHMLMTSHNCNLRMYSVILYFCYTILLSEIYR